MSDGIFVLNGDKLVELTEQSYVNEDVFQSLLAKHPNLLAGGQMHRSDPRRWLLIAREVSVPGELDGGGRWSLDHLFLDQDAIPTLVEVKRSSDTRIRREVVGQLLDYAANAVAYWPVEKMRASFEARCESVGADAAHEVESLVESRSTVDQFWQQAKTNLQAGKVRMVFVADMIPTELQRIVEFLNQQMDPAEVLAVEIKQYVGHDLTTLVPRVIGLTADAERRKGGADRPTTIWDEGSFLIELESRCGADVRQVAVRLIEWARQRGHYLKWGSGSVAGACIVGFRHDDFQHVLFDIYTYGKLFIRMKRLKRQGPFIDAALRQAFVDRLASIPGIELTGNLLDGEPGLKMMALADPQSLRQFLDAMEWAGQRIRE